MVSNAREDFPEPESPVMTVNVFFGMSREMFLRLFTRAFFIEMTSIFGIVMVKEVDLHHTLIF